MKINFPVAHVIPVPVLRLAHDHILELGILKPDRVVWFDPGLEGHGLVVDGVQEEVMDDFLRKKNTSDYVFLLCCTSSSSWGGTLKRES